MSIKQASENNTSRYKLVCLKVHVIIDSYHCFIK